MGVGAGLKAFNLQGWIEKNRHRLQPPVGNQLLFEDAGMIVMAIGGPNQRTDYHDDPVEEYFYQLKGNMVLRVMDEPGKPPLDIPIREGEVMLLPAHVRHSPQRPEAGSIGIVVESPRHDPYVDAFEWYCMSCHQLVYRFEYPLRKAQEIVTVMPPLFERFYADETLRECARCGAIHPGRKALQTATAQ
ncbi:MAG: 3-hydroxyanthranilate 3,4-dioxygenase [Burkholderiales bacterium]